MLVHNYMGVECSQYMVSQFSNEYARAAFEAVALARK